MPSFATLDDDALLIGISTPYMRSGLAYEKWERYFGRDDDDVLVVTGPSLTFNPTLPQRVVDAALARDPAAAQGEWLAQWRDAESAFLPVEVIRAAVDTSITVRPPLRGVAYFGFIDAAGGAGQDSFTAAIAHRTPDNTAVVDAVFEQQPPFSPRSTAEVIAELFRQYRVTRIRGDQYAGAWPAEVFIRHGIHYEPAEFSRSQYYVEVIPLFTSGRVRLLDHQKSIDQFAGLRRKVQPGGREHIDHLPHSHDDLSNAIAGCLVSCIAKKQPLVIDPGVLARSAIPSRGLWGGRAVDDRIGPDGLGYSSRLY